jgi:hypothetical protein
VRLPKLVAAFEPVRAAYASPSAAPAEVTVLWSRALSEQLAHWWLLEMCRRCLEDQKNDPLTAALTHSGQDARPGHEVRIAEERQGLAYLEVYLDCLPEALGRCVSGADSDGARLAVLLDDARLRARTVSFTNWDASHQQQVTVLVDRLRSRLASLSARSSWPVGRIALACWSWGARGTARRADRVELAAARDALLGLSKHIAGGAGELRSLAARMEGEVAAPADSGPGR